MRTIAGYLWLCLQSLGKFLLTCRSKVEMNANPRPPAVFDTFDMLVTADVACARPEFPLLDFKTGHP